MNRANLSAFVAALLLGAIPSSTAIAATAGESGAQEFLRVTTALKTSNPDFEGPSRQKIKGDRVIELTIQGSQLHDLSALHGMILKVLDCSRSQVRSLEPLRGMPLETLYGHYTKVNDLSPLKGMSLHRLGLSNTPVSDLAPLKGMPLTWLSISKTHVTDLEPLRGMPLKYLGCEGSKVSDLSVIRTMALQEIRCDIRTDRDKELLAAIPTLKKINGRARAQALGTDDEAPKQPVAPRAADADLQKDARKFARTQSSIKGLYIVRTDAGLRVGSAQDIIATAERVSGRLETVCDFTGTGAKDTRISMEEAERLLKVRYPVWEAGHKICFSYSNKYSKQAGGSAGGAFSVLLLSLLDGLQIDPVFAMTGDVTVDGKIREIGAAAEKIRGAFLERCRIVAIPEANKENLNDLAVLYSPAMLWSIQIVSIATLDDAAAVARVDRAENLAKAVELFAQVQRSLGTAATVYALRHPGTYQTLREVQRLAPNHLSAEFMLRAANNQWPAVLSLGGSLDEIWAAAGPLLGFLFADYKEPEKSKRYYMERVPAETCKAALERLNWLQMRLHPKTRDLKTAMSDYMVSLDQLHRASTFSAGTLRQHLEKRDRVLGEAHKLGVDRKVLEEMMH